LIMFIHGFIIYFSRLDNYCGHFVAPRRHKDLIILASPVQIPLWDMGAGLSDETVFINRGPVSH
jgi:hypothetical protein